MFAEVILPLPLKGTYTYQIPEELASGVMAGSRVMVQFGRKKFYTGIVRSVGPVAPPESEAYVPKPIMALLDSFPMASLLQMKLWDWVADYYLCTPGDVMRAAVPSGLKPESETRVGLNPDWDRSPEGLTEGQARIVAILSAHGPMSLSDLVKESGIATAALMAEKLLDAGVAEISERVVERYRPKKESMVRLTVERGDDQALHDALDIISRSPKQERLLMAYLDLSGWMRHDRDLTPVSRRDLLEKGAASPASLKALVDRGLMEVFKVTVNRFATTPGTLSPLAKLSDEQGRALREIRDSMASNLVTLLHGVTGSGKTEIYSHLISSTLAAGRQVLYLVPEISLTTQLTDRLRRIFGNSLIVYHSKFTDNERVEIYRRLARDSSPSVVLGVRSSVLLPFSNLGLVVVDEEHEASYKQFDPAPRYNARDTGIMLAHLHGAKVLLGSATPAVETFYKAVNGKYGLVKLSARFADARLPEVEIVDMPKERKRKSVRGILSDKLRLATQDTLAGGNQAIMFQNRRGFAPVVICRQCGWSPKCDNCDVSLVYHKQSGLMRCHYCGFTRQLPAVCPVCGLNELEVYGYGTERIAEELHREFPEYRVARMDLDTTRNKESQQEIIEEFANKQTDILVGTQMVSKGLDFAGVKLVGVLNADTLLNFPDFRSNERAFNMLEQVAGRAGRHGGPGRVIIQTSKADERVLDFVTRHDYDGYYLSEIEDREQFLYPPFTKVIMICLKNKDAVAVDRAAIVFASALRRVFGDRVLGPERPFVSRVANWYLQSIMLKIEAGASMHKVKELLRTLYEESCADPSMKGTVVYYDVDPV